jgi:hypothetical protein
MSTKTTCDCWEKTNAALEKEGLCLSEKHRTLSINYKKGTSRVVYILFTQKPNGSRTPKGKEMCVLMNNCPFCGIKLPEQQKEETQ